MSPVISSIGGGSAKAFGLFGNVIVSPAPTPTITRTITPTPTTTPTTTPSVSITPSITTTPTTTSTQTPTTTPTPTVTTTPTITPTLTTTPSETPTPTITPTITLTETPTTTITPSISITPSITPTRTTTPSITPTFTITPTVTPAVVIPIHDAVTVSQRTGTTDPHSFSHTPSGSIRGILVFAINYTNENDNINSVTYGGRSLTKIVTASDNGTGGSENFHNSVWFLGTQLPTGTQNVEIDLTGSLSDDYWFTAISITNDYQYDIVVQSSGSLSNDQVNPQVTLTYDGFSCLSYVAIGSGLPAPTDLTILSGMSNILSDDLGQESIRVDRQTTASTSNFTIGYTASTDDVAFTAVALRAVIPPSPSPTPTITSTITPTLTPSRTPTTTPTITPSNTTTPTVTPTITTTPTNTLTVTPTITITPTTTPTITPTLTITPSETPTPTITPSETPTPTITPSETPTPTITPTITPSITFTPTQTPTQTVTVTLTPTITPTSTITSTPSQTPQPSPSVTPSLTITPTRTPSLPAPTYLIYTLSNTVNEGDTVAWQVITTNVPNGTVLYYTNSGTTNASDFLDNKNSDIITISNNSANIFKTLTNDVITEGVETIILQLRTGSTSGPIVSTSNTVQVADTSVPPTPTPSLTPSVTRPAPSLTPSRTPSATLPEAPPPPPPPPAQLCCCDDVFCNTCSCQTVLNCEFGSCPPGGCSGLC